MLIDLNNLPTKSNHSQFSSSNVSNNNTKTIKNLNTYQASKLTTFSQKFSSTIVETLHYLICKNTKVWSVLINVVDEKYGISEFKTNFHSGSK